MIHGLMQRVFERNVFLRKSKRSCLGLATNTRRQYFRGHIEALESRVLLSAFSVVNTDDSGPGSLRQAILDANANVGPDEIIFAIPASDADFIDADSQLAGGDAGADVFVISPLTPLPALSDTTGGTTIDGRTQAAFGGETNPFGPEIVIDGSMVTGGDGLVITSDGNEVHGLNLQGFSPAGLFISGGDDNWVTGNYVGTDPTGTVSAPNARGILIRNAIGNIIGTDGNGDDDELEGNVVSGNSAQGIQLDGSSGTRDTVIAGNLIGTDGTGMEALGNNGIAGIFAASSASGTRIGTDGDGVADLAERNVVSANGFRGIWVNGGNTVVAGNLIGTDISGTVGLGNDADGIFTAVAATGAIIGTDGDGTADASERNVVSDNGGAGIWVSGGHSVISGNFIGTDVTGTSTLGNHRDGIFLPAVTSAAVRIGTDGDGLADAAERNVIAASARFGIWVGGGPDHVVAGNYIGTDSSGTAAPGFGNGNRGINVSSGATQLRIGTDGSDDPHNAAERNIVVSSGHVGIGIFGADTGVIAGNSIGIDADGTSGSNAGSGIGLFNDTTGYRIGTDLDEVADSVEGNVIAHNAVGVHLNEASTTDILGNTITANLEHGVRVEGAGAVENSIRRNAIHANGSLGIDLGVDGVTPNDAHDADSGPNDLQNFPVLTEVQALASTQVAGRLQSVPATSFTVDFHASTNVDSSGHGEGERWLGSSVVTTDSAGLVEFEIELAVVAAPGEFVTATATDALGNTSEFSAAIEIPNEWIVQTFATGVSSLSGPEALAFDAASQTFFVRSGQDPAGRPQQLTLISSDGTVQNRHTFTDDGSSPEFLQNSNFSGIASDPFTGEILIGTIDRAIGPAGIRNIDPQTFDVTNVIDLPWIGNPQSNGTGRLQFAPDLRPGHEHLLYFYDNTLATVFRLDRNTGSLAEIFDVEPQVPDGFHGTVNDIIFDPVSERLVLTDGPARSILSIDPDTGATETLFSGLPNEPRAVTLDQQNPDGLLFVHVGNTIHVGRRDGSGVLTLVSQAPDFTDLLMGPASDGVGRSVYFVDKPANAVREITSDILVPSNSPPEASAGGPYAIDEGQLVTLDASASTDPDGDSLTFAWDLDADGLHSDATGEVVSLTWADLGAFGITDDGSFPVSVQVTDDNGATDTASTSLVISNAVPSASISGPDSGVEGESLAFMALASDPADIADPLTFNWEVTRNDDIITTGTGTTLVFIPDDDGSYVVTLNVMDDEGGDITVSQMVSIENVRPLLENNAFHLNSWSVDRFDYQPPAPAEWWITSDATEVRQVENSHPSVMYSDFAFSGGMVRETIRVDTSTDDDFVGLVLGYDPGELSALDADYLIVDWKQETQTQGSQGTSEAGLAVSRVSGAASNVEEFFTHTGAAQELARGNTLGNTGWADFTELELIVEYDAQHLRIFVDGSLEFDLEATQDNPFPAGRIGFYNYSQPDAIYRIYAHPTITAVEGASVSISRSFFDAGSADTHTATIDWGDGTVTAGPISEIDGSGSISGNHTYPDDGTYEILISLEDDDGATDAARVTAVVENAAPQIAALILDKSIISEGETVELNGSFTDAGVLDTHGVAVNWGDGNVETILLDSGSRNFQISHTYLDNPTTGATSDEFTITATVTDDDGAQSQLDVALTVDNLPPVVTANQSAVTVNEGDSASNTGTFGDPGTDTVILSASVGSVTANPGGTWSWSFDSSDGPDDSQTVTITATDSDGAVATASFGLTVNNVPPTAVDDAFLVFEDDLAAVLDVLGNDSDPAGANDPLTITNVNSTGTTGEVTLSNGQVTYSPDGQFESLGEGQEASTSFTYTTSDGDGGSATADVVLTIQGQNDAPTLAGQLSSVEVNQNAADSVIDLTGLFADVDSGDELMLQAASSDSSLVTATVQDQILTLDYQLNQNGAATITLTATDTAGAPVSTSFDIVVLSPLQQVSNGIVLVAALAEAGKVNTSAARQLTQALNVIQAELNAEKNRTNSLSGKITAFVNQVESGRNSGRITDNAADQLNALAIELADSIGIELNGKPGNAGKGNGGNR